MKWKLAGIGLGVLLVLALSAWAWSLWTWKRDSQLTLAESQRQVETAQAQVETVKRQLNEANFTITELQARHGEQVVIKVPADCAECFKNHRISTSTSSAKGWWTYRDEDVLDDQPGTLDLKSKFWTDTVGPYKAAVEDCQKQLKGALGLSKPKFFVFDYRTTLGAGIGTDGYRAQARFEPFRIGGKNLSFGPWGEIGSSLGQDGLLRGWGAAGIEAQFQK